MQVDNINTNDDETTLANLFEVSIQRLLNSDVVELTNRVERGVLAEFSDNPTILRVLQAWQQSLALILATENGARRIVVEDTLPYLQDNVHLTQRTMANDLVGIAGDLPEYHGGNKGEKLTSSQILGGAILTPVTRQVLEVVEGVKRASEQTNQVAASASEAAQSASSAAQSASIAAQSASSAAQTASSAAENRIKRGAIIIASGTIIISSGAIIISSGAIIGRNGYQHRRHGERN